jgi:hypothetical protein
MISSEIEEAEILGFKFCSPNSEALEWTKDRYLGDNNTFRLKHGLTEMQDNFTPQIFSLNLAQCEDATTGRKSHPKETGHHCFIRSDGRRDCDVDCPIYVFCVGQHPPRISDYLERSFLYSIKFGRRF